MIKVDKGSIEKIQRRGGAYGSAASGASPVRRGAARGARRSFPVFLAAGSAVLLFMLVAGSTVWFVSRRDMTARDSAAAVPQAQLGAREASALPASPAVAVSTPPVGEPVAKRDSPPPQPAAAPSQKPAGDAQVTRGLPDPSRGCTVRFCTVAPKDGHIEVVGTQDGPPTFVLHPVKAVAGARVRLRVRCAKGGPGRVQWASKTAKGVAAEFAVRPGVWDEVEVPVAEIVGEATIVRILVPAKSQPVEVDWIELCSGGVTRRWVLSGD